jgi:hypothetical protein
MFKIHTIIKHIANNRKKSIATSISIRRVFFTWDLSEFANSDGIEPTYRSHEPVFIVWWHPYFH